ncbi:hypothetical protein KBZ20_02370 [Vulcanococcus limneticus Candia 3F8]|uniref:DUF6671 family protein n=1 Tax=Vulcanococcus limneticus TaxID=2170428 RepID=UPI0012FFAF39|nr:DUF6671 family protein [Vulcanococcus limneticus]MCP9790541.1 hypothetical protein [Vulcanococcus limneticus MW73D5]MCP9892620.1 hypothetical protein [Vulcanococcus limneticus Candia 3F8]MCP9896148.1 hypothetical protein [Vulcanococcus limneticus Candia 3B3]
MGLERSGLRLGLASEASFGPHPTVPLLAVGQEQLVCVDLDRPLTLVEQRLDWRTNDSQRQHGPEQDPSAWLKQGGFHPRGVIVRPLDRADGLVLKELTHPVALQEGLAACRRLDSQGQVWLETLDGPIAIPSGCARTRRDRLTDADPAHYLYCNP